MIEDQFIKKAEKIFSELPRDKIESHRGNFIVLNLRTSAIMGVFKTRIEAHNFMVNEKLDLEEHYLRMVGLAPLMTGVRSRS